MYRGNSRGAKGENCGIRGRFLWCKGGKLRYTGRILVVQGGKAWDSCGAKGENCGNLVVQRGKIGDSCGATGGKLRCTWRILVAGYWPDTRRDPPARGTQRILGGIHWQAALAGYSAGSTGEPLWWDTRQDPLASSSGGILGGIQWGSSGGILGGIHWRAALAGYSAGSTGEQPGGILGGIHWRAALAGYSAGSTGEPLWRDTRQDPLASGGYSVGSTGKPLWRDTRRDPLASSSDGILGGIHWRAALAGFWVGAWCRSIANTDSNIKSNNPFLPGGENTPIWLYSQCFPVAFSLQKQKQEQGQIPFNTNREKTHLPFSTWKGCFGRAHGSSSPVPRNLCHVSLWNP